MSKKKARQKLLNIYSTMNHRALGIKKKGNILSIVSTTNK